MSTPSQSVRLAGEVLRDDRHVCALFNGPADCNSYVVPFIVDGLEHGDRVICLVDPLLRDAHLERLRESGVDVAAVTGTGQLKVQTWTELYLRGGGFDRRAQLAFVKQSIGEGPALGYALTRIIASLDWAPDDDTTVSEIVAYEARVDEFLRGRRDVAVCTYDLGRHSSRTIADVLGVHPVVLVGGVVRTNRGPLRAPARDRLLVAAARLFQEGGLQASGVDALIEAAGIAKATFYRHFPSKDDLVVAWLRDPRTRWFDRVRAQAETRAGEGVEVIPAFFEALADWLEAEGDRGCPYLNTAMEIADPSHPARLVVADYLREIEDYLVGLARTAGFRGPRRLGSELFTLVVGSISLRHARGPSSRPLTARDGAVRLLKAAKRD